MIFYLATYPRSGNSQLQFIISQNFCFLTSQVKADGGDVRSEQWRVRDEPAPDGWPDSTLWTSRIATYQRYAPDDREVSFDRGRRWRYLKSGSMPSAEVRQALAAEPEPFFIKTHDLPFDAYFEGERVIQVRRNPGPVMWSYFRYLLDFGLDRSAHRMFEQPPLTLDRVIQGEVPFGDWSAYHRAWDQARTSLGERWLQIRYPDMTAQADETLRRISAFIGYPVEMSEVIDFASYNAAFSTEKGLRGADQNYEQFYTRDQLELLWSRHGALAEAYGIDKPDQDLAAAGDQIARLNKIIEIAWTWGERFDGERRDTSARLKKIYASRGPKPPTP